MHVQHFNWENLRGFPDRKICRPQQLAEMASSLHLHQRLYLGRHHVDLFLCPMSARTRGVGQVSPEGGQSALLESHPGEQLEPCDCQ